MNKPSLTQQIFPLKQLGLNKNNSRQINTALQNSFKQSSEVGLFSEATNTAC